MPPALTLEQVLARSMRLPAAKAAQQLSSAWAGNKEAGQSLDHTASRESHTQRSPQAQSSAPIELPIRNMSPSTTSTSSSTSSSQRADVRTAAQINVSRPHHHPASDWGEEAAPHMMPSAHVSHSLRSALGPNPHPTRDEVLRGLERDQRQEKEKGKRDLFRRSRQRREAAAKSGVHFTTNSGASYQSYIPVGSPSKNSVDLTSFLRTALQMRTYEEGIEAFCAFAPLPAPLTGLLLRKNVKVDGGVVSSHDENRLSSSQQQSASPALRWAPEHIHLMLSICEGANRLDAVEAVGIYFSRQLPSVLVRTTKILMAKRFCVSRAQHCNENSDRQSRKGEENVLEESTWQENVFSWLAATAIPPSEISVDVFNAMLSKCEAEKDYKGALYILQSMGPNPLSELDLPPPKMITDKGKETQKNKSKPDDDSLSSTVEGVPHRMKPFVWCISSPVTPNVVSYAMFIAVLEQCGQNAFASRVVSLLPKMEQQEITASYAALIYLWSQQVMSKKKWR